MAMIVQPQQQTQLDGVGRQRVREAGGWVGRQAGRQTDRQTDRFYIRLGLGEIEGRDRGEKQRRKIEIQRDRETEKQRDRADNKNPAKPGSPTIF